MKTKLTLLLTALLLGTASAFAQTVEVHGIVVSAQDGQPVIGASVFVQGTQIGAVTGINGNFDLKGVPSSATTLEVEFLGMRMQEVAITPGQIKVTLEEDTELLNEVVVTGYGTQRKASYTGSSAVVGEGVLSKKTDANFVKSLEGAVPGVEMGNFTSMPGTWGSVYIRGRASLSSGTQPLYVIDGMPINSDYVAGAQLYEAGDNNSLDPLTAVNPADIESVTVLKDAAATAIYGSRAANGVIVITTKRGSEGKLNINLDVKQGFVTMAPNNMNFANAAETMKLYTDGRTNAYGGSWQDNYDYLVDYFGWDGVTDVDWIDQITRKGYYQDYNLSFSGRTGQTSYFLSLGYLDTVGLVIGSDMKRYSGRVNLENKFKFITVGTTASFSSTVKDGFSLYIGGALSSPMVEALCWMTPMTAPYDEDGNYSAIEKYNPLAVHDKDLGDINRTNGLTANLNPYLRVDFGKGIYAKTTLGVNLNDTRTYNYYSAVYDYKYGHDTNGSGIQYNSRSTVITWTNILGWDYNFKGVHSVNVMLGQEMQRKDYFDESYSKTDFPFASSGMRDLSTAGTEGGSYYAKQEARLASYFIDAHYAYGDRYYVSGSFRRDGSSVFGANHRWGNFWSVGAKWRLTGEKFLSRNRTLTNASLRASYGTVGNQDIGWYSARGFYSAGYNYNSTPGMVPTSVSNGDLTWETTRKFDVGADLEFINRISVTLDYYNETTVNALYEVPLSMTTGLETAFQNIGSIRNQGIEFSLTANIIDSHDWTWDFNVNATWNQNRVVRLATDEPITSDFGIIKEGLPFSEFYLKEYAGVDRETGRPTWYLNETGDEITFDYNEAAKRCVGDADPKLLGGFGTSVTWKGIDLSIDFKYRLGNKVYDRSSRFIGYSMSYYTPFKDVVYNSWSEDNKDAKYPQFIYGDPYSASQNSSRFLYNGRYLRINNITLGYTFPSKWMQKALISKLRVYVSVDNPYTFTASDFRGYTPDTAADGIISFQYPATTTFIGGVQITLF